MCISEDFPNNIMNRRRIYEVTLWRTWMLLPNTGREIANWLLHGVFQCDCFHVLTIWTIKLKIINVMSFVFISGCPSLQCWLILPWFCFMTWTTRVSILFTCFTLVMKGLGNNSWKVWLKPEDVLSFYTLFPLILISNWNHFQNDDFQW